MNDQKTGTSIRQAMTALQSSDVFASLDPASLATLSKLSVWREWPSGSTVFLRGDAGSHMILVISGRLRLSLVSAAGREILLGTIEPGGVVGEVALIDGQPRSADATAMEPTVGLVIWRDAFLAAMDEDPRLGLVMARYLCSLLRATNFQMESIALHDLRSRLVRFVLLGLREAHGDTLPPVCDLRVRLNQAELSAMLGASRPKLNRALHDLFDLNALRRDGDILVCDTELLLRIAEDSGAVES
jgi:CRP-like cAMP-binding protein